MEFFFGVIILGFGAAVLVGLFYAVGLMLGFPMERKKTGDARQALARQMWDDKVNAEAARNVALRAAEKRLEG